MVPVEFLIDNDLRLTQSFLERMKNRFAWTRCLIEEMLSESKPEAIQEPDVKNIRNIMERIEALISSFDKCYAATDRVRDAFRLPTNLTWEERREA